MKLARSFIDYFLKRAIDARNFGAQVNPKVYTLWPSLEIYTFDTAAHSSIQIFAQLIIIIIIITNDTV